MTRWWRCTPCGHRWSHQLISGLFPTWALCWMPLTYYLSQFFVTMLSNIGLKTLKVNKRYLVSKRYSGNSWMHNINPHLASKLFIHESVFTLQYFVHVPYDIMLSSNPQMKTLHGLLDAALLLTWLFIPAAPLFFTWSVVNSVHWWSGSTQALPATTVLLLLGAWLLVGFPLTIIGGIVGKNRAGSFQAPCRTRNIPRQIPAQPWYKHTIVHMAIGGFLPFRWADLRCLVRGTFVEV